MADAVSADFPIVGVPVGAVVQHAGGSAEVETYMNPTDAVAVAPKPNSEGIPFLSDTPYDPPYEERPQCKAIKANGDRCGNRIYSTWEVCFNHEHLK